MVSKAPIVSCVDKLRTENTWYQKHQLAKLNYRRKSTVTHSLRSAKPWLTRDCCTCKIKHSVKNGEERTMQFPVFQLIKPQGIDT
jgi:hypothetical protein